MTQAITAIKQIMVCREKAYGTANYVTTATGNATAATRWADTGFGTTVIDGSNEDGTYFTNYYICPLTGTAANIGAVRKVSSWADADDEFVVASAFPSTPQSGDTAALIKVCRANISTAKPERAKLDRDYQSLTFTKPSKVAGKPMGTVEFTTEFIASLDDGAMHDLLLATMGSQLQAGDTSAVVSGGSTTALRITDTDASKFEVGGLIAVLNDAGSYEFAAVTAKDATPVGYDELTITPALSGYPSASNTVKALQCYQDAEEGAISITLVCWGNGERWEFRGCRGTVSINEMNTGNLPELSFTFQADSFNRTAGACPFNPQLPALDPPANFGGLARLNGSDYEMFKFAAELGANVTEKPIFEGTTGRKEWAKTNTEIKASCSIFNNSAGEHNALHDTNPTVDAFVVQGSPANAAGCVAVRLSHCKADDMSPGDEEGRGTWDLELSMFDNETDATTTRRLVLGFTT